MIVVRFCASGERGNGASIVRNRGEGGGGV